MNTVREVLDELYRESVAESENPEAIYFAPPIYALVRKYEEIYGEDETRWAKDLFSLLDSGEVDFAVYGAVVKARVKASDVSQLTPAVVSLPLAVGAQMLAAGVPILVFYRSKVKEVLDSN